MINNKFKLDSADKAKTPNFTKDQQVAVDALIEFIRSPWDSNKFKRGLSGPAGTGKTFVIKYIINNCGLSHSVVGLAAPTHKACRVLRESTGLSASTVQSDLGLRLNVSSDNFDVNNPPFDPMGRIKVGEYSLYIVDEASMINKSLKYLIEKECKENHCKLIYVGDEYQLAPVGELYSSAFKGLPIYKLTQIVRQGDDNPISPLLDMLRNDIKNNTFTFLNYITKNTTAYNDGLTKGYEVINEKYFPDIVKEQYSTDEFTSNIDLIKTIGYTNICVNSWNRFIRNEIIQDAEKFVITKNDLITSYTTIVNEFNEAIIKNSEEYIIKDIVNYHHNKWDIEGFLVTFTAIHGGDNSTPIFVVNHHDGFSYKMYYKICMELINAAKNASKAIRSSKWKKYYEFKNNVLLLTNIGDVNGKILIGRDLDYGFSLTSHKSQGSTYDNVFVDVNDIVYDKYLQPYANAEEINRRLYVACSRAKNKLYLKYGFNRM